jgi:hypothetical protein
MPGYRIQSHIRHKSAQVVAGYIREADIWTKSGLDGVAALRCWGCSVLFNEFPASVVLVGTRLLAVNSMTIMPSTPTTAMTMMNKRLGLCRSVLTQSSKSYVSPAHNLRLSRQKTHSTIHQVVASCVIGVARSRAEYIARGNCEL